jgi:hypothetical protein
MSNLSSQPPLQHLDFSNVGRHLRFGSVELPPVPFHEGEFVADLIEHIDTRIRTEDTFAMGVRSPASPNTRRVAVPHLHFPHIRTESKFKPIIHDKYYKNHCIPGHVRVFRSLIGPSLLEEKAFLYRDMPLNDFRAYVMSVVDPFNEVIKTPNGNTFSFTMPKENRSHLIDTWNKNLELRFKFRCLLSAWMVKKTQKNVINIQNYTSLEDPSPTNSITWLDITNRCTYRIDGDTLLKSMSMYLLNSSYGSPDPLCPKNPNTNIPFTHGQLVHLFFELYSWCGKNKKKIPSILTRFHDHNFSLHELLLHNKPLLAYNASKELFRELGSEDSVEQMLDCVENYGNSMINRIHYESMIPKWVEKVTDNHYLVKRWQTILPDILQYEQFKIFTRDEWSSLFGLRATVKALWDETVISISQTMKSKITVRRRIPVERLLEDVSPVQNTPPNVPLVSLPMPPNELSMPDLIIIDEVHLISPNLGLPSTAQAEAEDTVYNAIINHMNNVNPLPIDLIDSINSISNAIESSEEIHLQYQIETMFNLMYSIPQPVADSEEKEQESDEANV